MESTKSKGDRLREGITILKKLGDLPKDFLMFGQHKEYLQIKSEISKWVDTGVAAELKIPLYRQGRMAELNLPSSGATATLALKVMNGAEAKLD